jgi:hypothetical protein
VTRARLRHHLSCARRPVHSLHCDPPRAANPFLRLSFTLADTHVYSSKIPSAALSPPQKYSRHAIISIASTTLLMVNETRNHHYRPQECILLSDTLDRAPSADDEEEDGYSCDAYRRTRR